MHWIRTALISIDEIFLKKRKIGGSFRIFDCYTNGSVEQLEWLTGIKEKLSNRVSKNGSRDLVRRI